MPNQDEVQRETKGIEEIGLTGKGKHFEEEDVGGEIWR